jgi:hypothetical protein
MEFAFCGGKSVDTVGLRAGTRARGRHRTEVTEATEGGLGLVDERSFGGHRWLAGGNPRKEKASQRSRRGKRERFAYTRRSAVRFLGLLASWRSAPSQSGKKNIGIGILMPGERRGIERHFRSLGIKSELEFPCLVLNAWLSSISAFLGKLNIESAVPEFPCPVSQLHHPDIWNAAGRAVTAVGAKVIQRELPLVFDKSRCQPIFQIGFLKVVQDFRYDHWSKELVEPARSRCGRLWLLSSPLYLTPT